jgi:hypothetical protein
MNEKQKRALYTRTLEKSLNKIVSFLLKDENSDKDRFVEVIDSSKKSLDKVEKIHLENEYYTYMERLVLSVLKLPKIEFDLEIERDSILKEANRIRKIKRKKSQKRPKHKSQKFDDGN